MAELLEPEEYTTLQQDVADGNKRVFISRNLALQFYTHVGRRNVRDLTGKSVVLNKLIIFGLLLIAALTLLASFGLIIAEFGWMSVVIVPIAGIFWTIIAGFTTEQGTITISTVVLVAIIALTPFLPAEYGWPLALLVTSDYCYRLSHILAQRFLTKLLLTSYTAFDMLSEQVQVLNLDG